MTDIPASIKGQNIHEGLDVRNREKAADPTSLLITEPALRTRELSAPLIELFPEKVQPVLRKAYAKAQDEARKANDLMNIGERVVVLEKAQQQRIEEIAAIANSEIGAQEKKLLDARLEQMRNELEILRKICVRIAQGQDVPQLRNTSSPYDQIEYARLFRKEEVDKYGRTRNILRLAKRAFNKRSTDYAEGKEIFRYRIEDAFLRRRGAFERSFMGQRMDMEYITGYIFGRNQALSNNLDNISAAEPEAVSEVFSQGIDEFIKAVQELAQQAVQRTYYLNGVSNELANSPGEVRLGIQGKDLLSLTSEVRAQHARDIQVFINWLREYPKRIVSKVLEGLDPRIAEHLQTIDKTAEPIESRISDRNLEGSSISLEMAELLDSLVNRVNRFTESASNIRYFAINGTRALPGLRNRLGKVSEQAETSQSFPSSEDTLWHTTRYEFGKEVLRKGYLGSRKFQIDRFGEAVFLNEGVRVGKDYVLRGDKRMTKDEYNEQTRRNSRKNTDKEQFQLSFEINGPYRGGFDQGRNGIAFVFSQPLLFSRAQFMQADGWHLFDPSFSWDNQQSAGFSVNVIQEPMVLVVAEPYRNDFIQFVKSELTEDPQWKEELINPDRWISENVVFAPLIHFTDPQEIHEVARQAVSNSNALLNKKISQQIPQGKFMPTGEQGQTASPDVDLAPLFTYQSLGR